MTDGTDRKVEGGNVARISHAVMKGIAESGQSCCRIN